MDKTIATRDGNKYALHGLCVGSEISLGERLRTECEPDVNVSLGARHHIPGNRPEGRIVAAVEHGNGSTAVERNGSYTIRFHSVCEVRIAADRRAIAVHVAPGVDPGVAPILVTGHVLAFLLGLRGECVLHASAVQLPAGPVIAVAGHSGMGKSTIAALFCGAGARLVSDDLLRIERDGERLRCHAGTAQIRLRPQAAELAELFSTEAPGRTVDGRIPIAPGRVPAGRMRLDAILIPRPSRSAAALRVERLAPRDALGELIRYPRIAGWRAEKPLRAHLDVIAWAATRVPVFVASVPWGPPFSSGLAIDLVRELGVSGEWEAAVAKNAP